MTPKERAAMQQALEALENERSHMTANWDNIVKAITALREALAEQAEQEPVGVVTKEALDGVVQWKGWIPREGTKLYAAPVQQAEQEPDYFGLTHDHTWLSIDKKQYDKLKPEGRMACYAAPVSIEAAVLAEREACAKVCDDKHDYMCSRAAAAIRARGNNK